MSGQRFNTGKLRYSFIPPDMLGMLARVFTEAQKKYGHLPDGVRNWENGLSWMDTYDSLMRHLEAWRSGEKLDKESGLSHLSHAAWNALVLMTFEARGSGTDDRPHFPLTKGYKECPKKPGTTRKAFSSLTRQRRR